MHWELRFFIYGRHNSSENKGRSFKISHQLQDDHGTCPGKRKGNGTSSTDWLPTVFVAKAKVYSQEAGRTGTMANISCVIKLGLLASGWVISGDFIVEPEEGRG